MNAQRRQASDVMHAGTVCAQFALKKIYCKQQS